MENLVHSVADDDGNRSHFRKRRYYIYGISGL
jgi:hypothetical protein